MQGNEQHTERQKDSRLSPYTTQEELLCSQAITAQDVLDHLTGPVISIILHVIIFMLLVTFFVETPIHQKDQITIEVTEVDIKELVKPAELQSLPEEVVEETVDIKVETPTINTAIVDGPVAETVGVTDAPSDVKMPDLLSVKPSSSALKMPGIMAARGGKGRAGALKKYGGSSETERSVSRGLKWLVEHQNEDGSWGISQQGAMTGLAVLCFLAHGETPSSPEYGKTVLNGIKRLIAFADTCNSGVRGLISSPGNGYGHAIVAYALSEASALTRIPQVEAAMNKIIDTIVKGQNSLGSYDYWLYTGPSKEAGSDGQPRCDLSIAGWNYQALKAAFAAGAKVEGLESAIEKGIKAITEIHGASNGIGFSYGPRGKATHSMTAVGTLCLQLFGAGNSDAAKKALKYLESIRGTELTMDWRDLPSLSPLYLWYYQTQAIFQGHAGSGPVWKSWNTSFTKCLLKEQESDGHWETPTVKYADKKLDPKTGKITYQGLEIIGATTEGENMDMKVYSTTLCILMLEVYYRYLPTYKIERGAAPETGGDFKKKDDALEIKID